MAKSTAAWSAEDGTLFLNEQDAKDHEFNAALSQWWDLDILPSDGYLDIRKKVFEGRMKLLPIFKGLNGGSPITVPAGPPDRQSADVVEIPR